MLGLDYHFGLLSLCNDYCLAMFSDLMAQCTPLLKAVLERESKGWYIKYKDRIIAHLKGQNLSYKEITEVRTIKYKNRKNSHQTS